MSTLPHRRRRLTAAQREEVLQNYRRSALPQREFAAQAGVGLSTLQLWLRKAARRPPVPAGRFVEVPNLLPDAPDRPAYRLHLAGGAQLEIGPGFEPAELARLLRVLRDL